MAVKDPAAWVRNVERLYRAYDAEGVSALYTDDATTIFGSRVMGPAEVHAHHGHRLAQFTLEHVLARPREERFHGRAIANVTGLQWTQVDLEHRRAWIHPDQAKARKAIAVPLNTLFGILCGLAIVRKLVVSDGGDVALEESPSGGLEAVVRVRRADRELPREPPDTPEENGRARVPQLSTTAG
jgi:hypothetical protein